MPRDITHTCADKLLWRACAPSYTLNLHTAPTVPRQAAKAHVFRTVRAQPESARTATPDTAPPAGPSPDPVGSLGQSVHCLAPISCRSRKSHHHAASAASARPPPALRTRPRLAARTHRPVALGQPGRSRHAQECLLVMVAPCTAARHATRVRRRVPASRPRHPTYPPLVEPLPVEPPPLDPSPLLGLPLLALPQPPPPLRPPPPL
jgi:hypothetical protein